MHIDSAAFRILYKKVFGRIKMDPDCFFDCNEFNRYHINKAYPDVLISRPNYHYARLVSGAYAGQGSETTAIVQYMSHRYFVENYADVYAAYKYIAFTEVIHQNLLGRLILRLGLNPLLISYETNEFWRGSFPDYQYSLNQILESDIQGELNAIAHYERLIDSIDDKSIQLLFQRIIMDEQRHVEVLYALYAKYFECDHQTT